MIPRIQHLAEIRKLLNQFPVVCLIGARQVGKTTLARQLIEGEERSVSFFDLEDPTDEARLSDPKLALEPLRGLVVIDEVQRSEGLFRLLRVLVDRPENEARFLVLGSAGPVLLRQSSESLAGRIAYYELPPLRMNETGSVESNRLWLRGGFPPSFLAGNDVDSHTWRMAFIRSFLERDLPQLGVSVPAASMRRFWTMLAHYHGNHWNGAELGRALGVTAPTVNTYSTPWSGALVVRRMQPWYENLKKRQVKAPKVYISDTGLLHALLGVEGRIRSHGTSQIRSVVGGFRHAGGSPNYRHCMGRLLFLGDTSWVGTRPPDHGRWQKNRDRIQANQRTVYDTLYAHGFDRPEARPAYRRTPRGRPISDSRTRGSGRA